MYYWNEPAHLATVFPAQPTEPFGPRWNRGHVLPLRHRWLAGEIRPADGRWAAVEWPESKPARRSRVLPVSVWNSGRCRGVRRGTGAAFHGGSMTAARRRSGSNRRRRKKGCSQGGGCAPFIDSEGERAQRRDCGRRGGGGEAVGTTKRWRPWSEHGWHRRCHCSNRVADERAHAILEIFRIVQTGSNLEFENGCLNLLQKFPIFTCSYIRVLWTIL
jgi:hypothetical protein